jgi:hypothetical protein
VGFVSYPFQYELALCVLLPLFPSSFQH